MTRHRQSRIRRRDARDRLKQSVRDAQRFHHRARARGRDDASRRRASTPQFLRATVQRIEPRGVERLLQRNHIQRLMHRIARLRMGEIEREQRCGRHDVARASISIRPMLIFIARPFTRSSPVDWRTLATCRCGRRPAWRAATLQTPVRASIQQVVGVFTRDHRAVRIFHAFVASL
jgi:hypothetical protein